MSMQTRPRPLLFDRSRQASQQVFEWLRESIMSLELTPGAVLSRAGLAEEFGLSQTPVRDALMKLEEDGLVEIFPQHATVVSRISITSAVQAHFLRQAIELEVVALLARKADDEVLGRLRTQIGLQKAMAGRVAYDEFVLADRTFHRLMYEAAGVAELFDVVRRMSGHVDRLRRLHLPVPGKMQTVMRDHRRIVDAIARRDPEAARECLRDHLSGTLGSVDEIMARHPDYVIR